MQLKIYLDSSDLQRAFEGSAFNADPLDQEFFRIVSAAATENSFCFSFHHLNDLCFGKDHEKVLKRAQWIDSLPNKLWLIPYYHVFESEIRAYLLEQTTGRKNAAAMFNSFLAMFRSLRPIDFIDLTEVLKHSTVEGFCRNVLKSSSSLDKLLEVRDSSVREAMKLRIDRQRVIELDEFAALAKSVEKKLRADLLACANIVHARLVDERNPDYAIPDQILFKIPSAAWVEEKIDDLLKDLSRTPHIGMINHALNGHAQQLTRESMKFSKFADKHESDYDDFGHLVGGAYCDLFTCDTRTSGYIGNYRKEKLGLPDQLSYRKRQAKDFNNRFQAILDGTSTRLHQPCVASSEMICPSSIS